MVPGNIPVIWSKTNPVQEWLLFLCTPIGMADGMVFLWDELNEGEF